MKQDHQSINEVDQNMKKKHWYANIEDKLSKMYIYIYV